MEPILCEWDEDEEDYVPVSDPDNIESIVDSAISDAIKNANTVDDSVRNDADKWITVHPHGGTGTPALIGEDG